MRWVKFFISLLFTAAIAIALYFPAGPAPALGDFLNPFRGFWQNAVSQEQQAPLNLSLPALEKDAKVVYDERGVPHIFYLHHKLCSRPSGEREILCAYGHCV